MPVPPPCTFICSFRITEPRRLEKLALSLAKTLTPLQGRYPCRVMDASPEPFAGEAERAFRGYGCLDLHYQRASRRFPEAWLELLRGVETELFVALFDDQPIIGLRDETLAAWAALMAQHEEVDAGLFVAASPSLTIVDDARRRVEVVPGYNPFVALFRDLESIVTVSGVPFFVVRRAGFIGKFFFNNGLFRTSTYIATLEAFLLRSPDATAAQLEMDHAATPHPFKRFAYAYDATHVVDLDDAHTVASARRSGLQESQRRRISEAVASGYATHSAAFLGPLSASELEIAAEAPRSLAAELRQGYYRWLLANVLRLGPVGTGKYLMRNAIERGTWTRLHYRLDAALAG